MGLLNWLFLSKALQLEHDVHRLEQSSARPGHHRVYKKTVYIPLTEDEYSAMTDQERFSYEEETRRELLAYLPAGTSTEDIALTVIPKRSKKKHR